MVLTESIRDLVQGCFNLCGKVDSPSINGRFVEEIEIVELKRRRRSTDRLFSGFESLFNYVSNDDIIAETNCNIQCPVKPWTMLQLECVNEPWLKTLGCPHVYDEYVLKETFVEGLPQPIRQSMLPYCTSQRTAPLHKVVYKTTPLTKMEAAERPEQ